MALPTLTKTWRFRVNENIPSASPIATQNADHMIRLIDAMLGGGSWTDSAGAPAAVSNPWTVVASNGRLTGPSVGFNVLTSISELVWATTGNQWWIILERVDGVQVMIGCPTNATSYNMEMAFSVGGLFSGGTATALPTAPDQVVWSTNGAWNTSTVADCVMHVLHSTDGLETRIIFCQGGGTIASIIFGNIRDPEDGIASPFYVFAIASGIASLPTNHSITGSGGIMHGTAANFWMRHASTSVRLTLTVPAHGSGGAYLPTNGILVANEFQAVPKWLLIEPEVWGYTTIGGRGHAGELHDIWVPNWSPRSMGDQYPGDGTRQFAQLGYLAYPWNGTVCLVA